MKAELTGRKYNKGMITLELLIAFTILILCITGSILVASQSGYLGVDQVTFGNQSVAIDSQTNNEAIFKAQEKIEQARALSRQNFLSVVTNSYTIPSGPITYDGTDTVLDISQCLKQVITNITWTMGSRPLNSTLVTLLGNPATALAMGGDCVANPGGGTDWHNPQPFATIPRGAHGSDDTTDVDVDNRMLYISGASSAAVKDDIMVWDASALDIPTNTTTLTMKDEENYGLKHFVAIDEAKNNTTGKRYSYLYAGNDANTNQFQVVDVSNPTNIANPATAILSLPGVVASASGGGNVFFYKNKVYVGIGYLIAGDELHIFDVSDPTIPVAPASCIMSCHYNVNNNIYKIFVRDQQVPGLGTRTLAYLALSGTAGTMPELEIYDVTDPTSISLLSATSIFNPPGTQYGTALYVLGNYAYLGRLSGTKPNFYVIDISDPNNPTSCATCNFTISGENINDIAVSGNFAFIGHTDGIQILDVSDPANVKKPTGSPFGFYQVNNGVNAIDIDSDFAYGAVNNQGSTAFYIFYSAP